MAANESPTTRRPSSSSSSDSNRMRASAKLSLLPETTTAPPPGAAETSCPSISTHCPCRRLVTRLVQWRSFILLLLLPVPGNVEAHSVQFDLAFSAGYQIDSRCFLNVNFFTVEKRMEVRQLKALVSMTKSRLKVSSSRPTEWGSSPCFPRATAARTPDAGERCMFRPMTVPDLHHAWLMRMTGGDPRIGCHADPLWHQPESHYQPKAIVRCELIHKHGFGLFLGFATWR